MRLTIAFLFFFFGWIFDWVEQKQGMLESISGTAAASSMVGSRDFAMGGAGAAAATGSAAAIAAAAKGHANHVTQSRMMAMRQVQEILLRMAPSIGPYFVVPANFEIYHWNEIMRALTSGTMQVRFLLSPSPSSSPLFSARGSQRPGGRQ